VKLSPARSRSFRRAAVLFAAAFIAGALFGSIAVLIDPANGERLVPQDFFTESPRERVEKIERNEERIGDVEKALVFGASLYTHNIKVAFLAFSLGASTILLGLVILFYNGVILGAVATMYVRRRVGVFLRWSAARRARITAIIFGGGGAAAGRALLMPGDLSRGASPAARSSVWR
jgi:uncharacterized membrane protein SpoIIM required for sporulation